MPAQKKLKENDERLIRNLTLDEFILAFGRYKRIMCSAFPNRSQELDTYMAHVIETANIWPDRFFEYHKMFSAKCAVMLLQHNVKLDWSKGDPELRALVCAGAHVKTCSFCGSTIHSSHMCPQKSLRKTQIKPGNYTRNAQVQEGLDIHGREILYYDGNQVCNNFNTTRGCSKPYCKYLHICKSCKSAEHNRVQCTTSTGTSSKAEAPKRKATHSQTRITANNK